MSRLIDQCDWMEDAEYFWGWTDQAKEWMNEVGPKIEENKADDFKSKNRESLGRAMV